MIRYNSNNQISIEEFSMPFEAELDSENRWVLLSKQLPWDEMAGIYYRTMSADQGAPGIDARIVIGAMIIKHKEKLDDRGCIQAIKENPYMQYFLGLRGFTKEEVFDASLFVTIRKRIGVEEFDKMSQLIIGMAMKEKKSALKYKQKDKESNQEDRKDNTAKQETTEPVKNKGKIKLDATVADAYIKYPTDLDLLNDSREKAEELIDVLSKKLKLKKKPRTYRKKARKQFLLITKKKNKSKKEIRRGIRQQLGYLNRDNKHLNDLLDKFEGKPFPFDRLQQKYLFVIQHVYMQQKQMYDNNEHSCPNRIVSIHQPHVRPIVRGKAKANVEFGAKTGVSLVDGYARIDNLSWEAYNECADLIKQIKRYKELYGFYPEVVQVDGIYLNRENRAWMKEHSIRYVGKPLGRPPKEELTAYQKRKKRK